MAEQEGWETESHVEQEEDHQDGVNCTEAFREVLETPCLQSEHACYCKLYAFLNRSSENRIPEDRLPNLVKQLTHFLNPSQAQVNKAQKEQDSCTNRDQQKCHNVVVKG